MLQRGYEGDWLGGTFSRAVFLGNGLVAIVAGLVAHGLVETLSFGPVAPFDAAGVIMLLGGLVVLFSWTENYGDASNKRGFLEQLQSGARAIANGASTRALLLIYHLLIVSLLRHQCLCYYMRSGKLFVLMEARGEKDGTITVKNEQAHESIYKHQKHPTQ